MMRDELERELAEQFDADQLSVYGDYLQSIGDPRGDLIAFDLHELDDTPRRAQLIVEWLGSATVELIATATIEYGFITDLYLDSDDASSAPALDAVLAGPGAPYLRGVTIRGDPEWTRLAVEKLVTRSHVWLQRLSVQTSGCGTGPAVDDALARSLAHATPRLEQLEVWGRRVFGDLAHDALRSLCVTGCDALGTLLGAGAARLSAAGVLDLAFHVDDDDMVVDRRALDRMLDAERLPRLRRLDLSRNEPGTTAPHYLGGRIDAARFLASLAIRKQLTHVRLPSVRSQIQGAHIASAIADMPALRELSIVRGYRQLAYITLPSCAVPSTSWSWLPMDLVARELDAVVSRTSPARFDGDAASRFALPVPPLVLWLEQHFEDLPAAIRSVWLELFEHLSFTDFGTTLPRRAIRAALERLDTESDALRPWRALQVLLDELGDEAVVLFRLV
jgi:hypothetical protein